MHHPPLRCRLGLAATRAAAALLALAGRLLTRESPLGCLASENATALRCLDGSSAERV